MLSKRTFRAWRICQRWHFDRRFAPWVPINTKNPIPAINRAKAAMRAQNIPIEEGNPVDFEVNDFDEKIAILEPNATIDLTDSLPNRVTRSAKRALHELVTDTAPNMVATDNNNTESTTKKQRPGPKPKAASLRAPRRTRRQYNRVKNVVKQEEDAGNDTPF